MHLPPNVVFNCRFYTDIEYMRKGYHCQIAGATYTWLIQHYMYLCIIQYQEHTLALPATCILQCCIQLKCSQY